MPHIFISKEIYEAFHVNSTFCVIKCVLPRQLLIQQKRYRGKINIQRPQKLFYERAVVDKYVTPYYRQFAPPKPLWEVCSRVNQRRDRTKPETHPYQRIIARECRQRFETSKMVAFLHKNSIYAEDEFDFAVVLHKSQMALKYYGRAIMTEAIVGTRFEPIMPLFCAPGLIVFGAEVTVKELQKALKKTPQLILMAGIIEGQLLNVNDFLKYGKMTLTETRSELVHTLRTAGGSNLHRQLNHHQSTLVSRLGQICEMRETKVPEKVVIDDETKPEESKVE